ncbi:MAG: TIGR03936 family radical SAM-associated protein [Coriobacteriia bacterium]|nr:TIGR03936 family radical SAM-associated protein [Coriobacteriia bacterium]
MSDISFRLRIDFQKAGALRWLSHLELLRSLERLVRRSGLPYVVTQGFNAHMRLAAGPALPVGTAGQQELFDVWLRQYVSPQTALEALRRVAGELYINAVRYVDTRSKGIPVTHCLEAYEVTVASARGSADEFSAAFAGLLAAGTLEVQRRQKLKAYDLGETVVGGLTVAAAGADACAGAAAVADAGAGAGAADGQRLYRLGLTLHASSQGSLRPEHLVERLLLEGDKIVANCRIGLYTEDGEH